jgi:Glycine transporter
LLPGFSPTLLLVLNLVGTFVFGLSGGMAGVRKQLDVFGAIVLALVVGIAGGTIRDLLIGIPPATFRDWPGRGRRRRARDQPRASRDQPRWEADRSLPMVGPSPSAS